MKQQSVRVGWPSASDPAADAAAGGDSGVTTRRVPDFFIAGHPKSGTTALYEMLSGHPQIFMPKPKELWFLAEELRDRPPPLPGGMARTLEEYLALFEPARPGQRVGEATTLYLWSQSAAGAIARLAPQARVIVVLREPASFLRSLHLQFVESYIETESDLARAIALEGARREGRGIPPHTYWPRMLLYSEHVRYVEQLRRFREALSPEQVLVLIYDDFRRDNEAVLRSVMRFLGVDDAAPIETVEANPTVAVRSQRLHELVHAVSVGRGPASLAVKGTIKALTPRGLRRRALRAAEHSVVYTSPPPPDEHLMLELRRRFRGEVQALSEYLERDLVALWGYDELG